VKTLAERLKWLREHRNLSQPQLARLAKVSTSTIGNAEASIRKSLRDIARVAEALDTTPLWLTEGRDPAPDVAPQKRDKVTIDDPPGSFRPPPKGAESRKTNPILTSMPFDTEYLESTILLLGSLLGALDARSRRSIGGLLQDLSEKPDDREDIAQRVVANARVSNVILDRVLKGKGKRNKPTDSPETIR
jgi:transcriptional regulator with XRE-family HTH domain